MLKLTFSATLRLARELIGPEATLKRHNGGWRIYTQKGTTRTVYGEAMDLLGVINDCFRLESEVEAEAREKFGVLVTPESHPKDCLCSDCVPPIPFMGDPDV